MANGGEHGVGVVAVATLLRKLRPRWPSVFMWPITASIATRGVPRADDRRVISGIVHVLRSGCRWADTPQVYGP